MTRPKRVSIKGRGSDLFFGDGVAALSESVMPNPEPLAAPQDEQKARKQASLQASDNASKLASNITSRQSGQSASRATQVTTTNPAVEVSLASLWDGMSSRATIANTFRFTEEELARLEDVIYALTKSQRSKFSRQDVIRLGLNLALWDYETRGDASLLAQVATRRKQVVL